jgi:hypothetical protein
MKKVTTNNTNADKEFSAAIGKLLAESYSRALSERIKHGLASKRAQQMFTVKRCVKNSKLV